MAQRQMCPSMGALRRRTAGDLASVARGPFRALSSSARCREKQPDHATPWSASAAASPNSRLARSATALKQINNLQIRRTQPGSLARGSSPSRQMARRTPSEGAVYDSTNFGASAEDARAGDTRATNPRMATLFPRPTTTRGSSPPGGQMVRAPPTLRITSNAVGGNVRGPNLGRRSVGRGGPRGDRGPGGREQGPKKRPRKDGGDAGTRSQSIDDISAAATITDGMLHHLLRLQRKEWDRVPYEPKYAPGSFAAQELIHEGRELFRGEAPPVKIWGELEKRIGVVGMFGAEAHLKVKRVPDGDAAPFGQEDLDGSGAEEEKKAVVQ